MKKLLLIACIISYAFNSSAQCDDTLPVLETFDTDVINVCWNIIDNDNGDGTGDGFNWYWKNYGSISGIKCLISRSYSTGSGPLTPDNWIVSYPIDLTSFSTSETIELSWKVRGESAPSSHEYYTVYAATSNQINDFESSAVNNGGEYADEVGAAGVFITRTLDISELAGEMVYLAFRHKNDYGAQYAINIDDVSISSSLLGNDDFEASSFKHYYNTNTDILTLKSSNRPIDHIEIFNILGQRTLTKKLSETNETINLSSFKDGIYIARLTIDNSTKTIKFLKQ